MELAANSSNAERENSPFVLMVVIAIESLYPNYVESMFRQANTFSTCLSFVIGFSIYGGVYEHSCASVFSPNRI
jgi:hypothetical protein